MVVASPYVLFCCSPTSFCHCTSITLAALKSGAASELNPGRFPDAAAPSYPLAVGACFPHVRLPPRNLEHNINTSSSHHTPTIHNLPGMTVNMSIEEYLLAADELVARILHQWDMSSTCIAAGLVALVAYLAMSQKQPDTHPMLLARQSQPSPVRLPGQSAVYRSHTSPHGLPLNNGLNVKDVGKNMWQPGRDGDLRDIWRRVVTGRLDEMGQPTGEKGRIITVLGSEETTDHNLGT